MPATAQIVIPTGRNGFCCIIPCALLFALYGVAALVISLGMWRVLRGLSRKKLGAGPSSQRP